jgi:multiple sugar transport system substrate-binding protein
MPAATPTPEPVTITFAYFYADGRHFEELIPIFNETYPHITVELKGLRYIPQFQSLKPSEADAVQVYQGFLLPLHEQGHILSLTSIIDQDEVFDLEALYPAAVKMVSIEGEVMAIPSGIQCGVMVYNKELFDRYQVPYPQDGWTWDDFLSTAAALRDPAADVYGFAAHLEDPMYYRFFPHYIDPLYFVYQNGGRIFDDWDNPTRTTFEDPLTVEAIEWYVKLIQVHDVAPSRVQARKAFVGDPRGWQGFMLEKVAMIVAGADDRFPRPGQSKAVQTGRVAMPRGKQSATICVCNTYALLSETEHVQASWQWIRFLSEQMPPRWMPARKALAASDEYEEEEGADVAAAARAAIESTVVLPFYMDEARMDEIELFYEAVIAAGEGEVTVPQALFEAQEKSKLK